MLIPAHQVRSEKRQEMNFNFFPILFFSLAYLSNNQISEEIGKRGSSKLISNLSTLLKFSMNKCSDIAA